MVGQLVCSRGGAGVGLLCAGSATVLLVWLEVISGDLALIVPLVGSLFSWWVGFWFLPPYE